MTTSQNIIARLVRAKDFLESTRTLLIFHSEEERDRIIQHFTPAELAPFSIKISECVKPGTCIKIKPSDEQIEQLKRFL